MIYPSNYDSRSLRVGWWESFPFSYTTDGQTKANFHPLESKADAKSRINSKISLKFNIAFKPLKKIIKAPEIFIRLEKSGKNAKIIMFRISQLKYESKTRLHSIIMNKKSRWMKTNNDFFSSFSSLTLMRWKYEREWRGNNQRWIFNENYICFKYLITFAAKFKCEECSFLFHNVDKNPHCSCLIENVYISLMSFTSSPITYSSYCQILNKEIYWR